MGCFRLFKRTHPSLSSLTSAEQGLCQDPSRTGVGKAKVTEWMCSWSVRHQHKSFMCCPGPLSPMATTSPLRAGRHGPGVLAIGG
jgi:hypothetical protein